MKRGIEALVLQSQPYVHPAWVKFESWRPTGEPGITARTSMTVTLSTQPYHRFEAIYKVEWEKHGQTGAIDHLYRFDESDMERMMNFLSSEPSRSLAARRVGRILKPVQLRQQAWQLWKPTNKVLTVRRDWLWILSAAVVGVGVLSMGGAPIFGIVLILGGIAGLVAIYMAPRVVRNGGKPLAEPRILSYLDAWQTVIFDAGSPTCCR